MEYEVKFTIESEKSLEDIKTKINQIQSKEISIKNLEITEL